MVRVFPPQTAARCAGLSLTALCWTERVTTANRRTSSDALTETAARAATPTWMAGWKGTGGEAPTKQGSTALLTKETSKESAAIADLPPTTSDLQLTDGPKAEEAILLDKSAAAASPPGGALPLASVHETGLIPQPRSFPPLSWCFQTNALPHLRRPHLLQVTAGRAGPPDPSPRSQRCLFLV